MATEKRNDEEQFIFSRMVEGDKNAFRFFFEKYYTDLCNLVNIYIADHFQLSKKELLEKLF
ncbi:MAG: hypothetical protein LC658_10410 [Bacteroidales bacterium]|nr:hypothetical protein [Bacteroidales bacterium]